MLTKTKWKKKSNPKINQKINIPVHNQKYQAFDYRNFEKWFDFKISLIFDNQTL